MKKSIHPAYHQTPVVCACGNKFTIGSTLTDTIKLEVCYVCHPFYTGKQKIIDTSGRVDKFKQRLAHAEKQREKKNKPLGEIVPVVPEEAAQPSGEELSAEKPVEAMKEAREEITIEREEKTTERHDDIKKEKKSEKKEPVKQAASPKKATKTAAKKSPEKKAAAPAKAKAAPKKIPAKKPAPKKAVAKKAPAKKKK